MSKTEETPPHEKLDRLRPSSIPREDKEGRDDLYITDICNEHRHRVWRTWKSLPKGHPSEPMLRMALAAIDNAAVIAYRRVSRRYPTEGEVL